MPERAGSKIVQIAVGLLATATLSAAVVLAAGWFRPPDHIRLGREAYASRNWTESARLARERLKSDPEDREALRLLARSLGRQENPLAAAAFWRLGIEGAEAEDFYLLARSLLREGERNRAYGFLAKAREADPRHGETLFTLANLSLQDSRPRAALELSRELAAIPDWRIRGNSLLGSLLLRRHDGDGATAALSSVRDAKSSDEPGVFQPADLRKQLARAHLIAGHPEAAEIDLGRDLDPEADWLLSRSWLQRRRPEEFAATLARSNHWADTAPTNVEPAAFVGDARCERCHVEITRAHAASRHARTFAQGARAVALDWPVAGLVDPRRKGSRHLYAKEMDGVRVEARDEQKSYPALVAYVLGSGNRGQTAIVREAGGAPRESRLTHYGGKVGWNLTVHHPETPEPGPGLLGKRMIEDQVEDCLHCHTTDVRTIVENRKDLGDIRGIGCERCHGPGGNHLIAAELKLDDRAIGRARNATVEARTALCAECHKAPEGALESSRDFVRFQSPNLAKSRCVTRSGGVLDCTTCHDPHRDAETSPGFYESICLDCHGGKNDRAAGVVKLPAGQAHVPCRAGRTAGCLDCHMPGVPEAIPHTNYTDHFIRVRERPRP